MPKKLNNQIIDNWLQNNRPGMKRIGNYVSYRELMSFRCECGNIWETTYGSVHSGRHCPECGINIRSSKRKVWTNGTVDAWIEQNRPNAKRIGDIINVKTPTDFQCECGNIWKCTPDNFIHAKKQCRQCGVNKVAGAKRLSNEDIDKWIEGNRPDTKRIGDYKNNSTAIDFQCECGNIWPCQPNNFKNGASCPECANTGRREKHIMTQEEYIKRCAELNIEVLDDYQGIDVRLKHRCKICGTIFDGVPHSILYRNDVGCPTCRHRQSRGERLVQSILIDMRLNFEMEWRVKINGHNRRYDFFIESEGIVIEYDGQQHFEPKPFHSASEEEALLEFDKIQEADKDKNDWATLHGLRMIRIPYTWDDEYIAQYLNEQIGDDIV